MKRELAIGGFGICAAMALATQTALAGPAVSTNWQQTTMTQERCLSQAEVAISKTGFGELERTTQSRFGTLREYTASIRCITDMKIIFFLVSGPSRSGASRHVDKLMDNF